jgi:hypothetical protein
MYEEQQHKMPDASAEQAVELDATQQRQQERAPQHHAALCALC